MWSEDIDKQPLLNGGQTGKLSWKTRIVFGIGELGIFTVTVIQGFFLLDFLLEVADIGAYWAGMILLISQFWDGLIDPFIGRFTDSTNSRWGRRRPWLLFCSIPMGLSFWLLWQVPSFLKEGGLVIYYLCMLLLLNFFHTAVAVPYGALTPDLTKDYDERTLLTSLRFGSGLIGGIVSSFGMAIIVDRFHKTVTNEETGLPESVVDGRKGYMLGATIFAIFIALTPLLTGIFIRETYNNSENDDSKEKVSFRRSIVRFLKGVRDSLRNKPFVLITITFAITWVVINFIQNNLILWVKYVLRAEDHFPYLLLTVQGVAVLALFPLQRLSARIGKRTVYAGGLITLAIMAFCFGFIQSGRIGIIFSYILAAGAGIGLSTALLLPWSMLPDAVDWDELKTGKRREGDLYALFLLVQRIALGLALATSSWSLGAAGYKDRKGEDDDHQPKAVIWMLRTILSWIPVVLLLLALIPLYFYPLTKTQHQIILAQLAERDNKHDQVVT